MSIFRIVSSPADLAASGFTFVRDDVTRFDIRRVDGAFEIKNNQAFEIGHEKPAGNVTWYHYRFNRKDNYLWDPELVNIYDDNNNLIVRIEYSGGFDSEERIVIYGDTVYTGGWRRLGTNVNYSYDIRVEVTSTEVTASLYVNSALVATGSVANTGAATPRGKPVQIVFSNNDDDPAYISEIVIADEDTRGMRTRELRPTSFGVFQEWDGGIEGLRDEDLATGISSATANRRASFGLSKLNYVTQSDVVNRIVVQSYAQRGETGITSFNHFFRFGDGSVEDGGDIALTPLGQWYVEEYPLNPSTGLAWTPDDLAGLQTGVRSRA